jgi:AcrR family transcriptional regulator
VKRQNLDKILELFPTKVTKGDLKKAEIINATIDCIATIGWENTSYDAIGKNLGIGRAHVAYYFKDKDELFLMAFKFVSATAQEETRQEIDKAKNFTDKYLASAKGALNWLKKHPKQVSVVMAFYYLASINKKFRAIHAAIRKAGHKRLYDHLITKYSPAKASRLARDFQNLVTSTVIELHTTQGLREYAKAEKELLTSLKEMLSNTQA